MPKEMPAKMPNTFPVAVFVIFVIFYELFLIASLKGARTSTPTATVESVFSMKNSPM
jgi:hypothetical protein